MKIKDSLLTVLQQYEASAKNDTISLSDTNRIKIMNKLAFAYFRVSENQNLFLQVTRAQALAMNLLAVPDYSSNITLKRELGQVHLTLSVYYELVGDYPKSLENHFKCVNIREELGDHMGVAEATNIAGNLYKNQGNYVKGLEMYLKALTIRQKIQRSQPDNKTNKKGIAGLYNNIGLVYKMQKKYDECIKIFLKSLELKQSLGEELSAANTMGNLGTVYSVIKNFEVGTEYHMKALKIQEEYGDKRGIATTYYNLAENLIMRAENSSGNQRKEFLKVARQYLDKTLNMAKEIGDPGVLKDFYQAYTAISELQEDYGQAIEHYKLYIHFRDSLFNSENIQKTVKEELNNEFEKKELIVKQKQEAKEELSKRENEKHKMVRNLFIVGFGCMLVLAVLIFVNVRQKQKANHFMSLQKQEVEIQKNIAEKKQKQIIDSINYAKRIQSSILPELHELREVIPDCFTVFLPKDIVSGDFYWFTTIPSTKEIMVVVADCTGHGVPGAFLSMVGTTLLNEIVVHKHITDPTQIVKELSYGLSLTMINKEEDQIDVDGMDVSICRINTETRKLFLTAVNQNVFLVNKNGLRKINPQINSEDGIFDLNATLLMSTLEVDLEPDTWIYIPTDGFAEQTDFKNEEFGSDRLGELFRKIHTLPSEEQNKILNSSFTEWKGSSSQIDDVCIIGVRL